MHDGAGALPPGQLGSLPWHSLFAALTTVPRPVPRLPLARRDQDLAAAEPGRSAAAAVALALALVGATAWVTGS
jgi:hypothetical protein